VISVLVAAEIADAPEEVRIKFAELLYYEYEYLELTEDAEALAEEYERRGILPHNCAADALHIASATVAEVDALVSWNFKHVVHMTRIRLFNAVNMELGYRELRIYSPPEVAHDDNQGG
jgi:hypothetical protein